MVIAEINAARLSIILFFLVLISFSSRSQNVNASVQLDSSDFRIGDPIALTVNIDHPYGVSVEWPQNTIISGEFEKLSESRVDSIRQNSFLTEKKIITITTFDTGRILTPEVQIFYHDKNGTLNNIATNGVPIHVSLADVNLNNSFRPIAPPLSVATPDITMYLVIAGIFLVLILFFVLRMRRRKRKQQIESGETIKPKDPVLIRLQNLEEEMSQQKISVEQFYLKLTSLLREYIEQRFSFPAFEHTSSEIIRYMKKYVDDHELLEEISENFELADFVKFAKVLPSKEENQWVIQSALDFVKKTGGEKLPEKIGTGKTPTNAI